MIKKVNVLRVLDTSAIVQDPKSLLAYEDDVHVCLTVLEELDNLKERREKSVSADARVAIRLLEELIGNSTSDELKEGIALPSAEVGSRGKLFVGIDTDLEIVNELKHDALGDKADNHIINYALHLKKDKTTEVCLVSRDINMRLKARALGLLSEDVPAEVNVSDIDLLYPGAQVFEGSVFDLVKDDDELKVDRKTYRLPRRIFNDECQVNMYWYDGEGNAGRIVSVDEQWVTSQLLNKGQKVWGVEPKNDRQRVALDQLTAPDLDLNILLGPAGSGKTFLAVAAALELVLEQKRHRQIIVVRSRDFMDDDPGFLPGDITEKVLPLMAGVTDSLMSLHGDDEGDGTPAQKIAHIIERANIQFESMAYFRGRSVNDAVLIIDESQNMTRAQTKGMLSRGGKNCRTILLGNLGQIDDQFVTAASSGLSAAVNTYRHYENGSVLIFDEVERSPLAKFTEENF